MLVAALGRAADTVHALVGLLGGEAAEGQLGGLALLLDEVVEPICERGASARHALKSSRFQIHMPSFRSTHWAIPPLKL